MSCPDEFLKKLKRVLDMKNEKELEQFFLKNFGELNTTENQKTRFWLMSEIANCSNPERTKLVISFTTINPEEDYEDILKEAIWSGNVLLSEFFLSNQITIKNYNYDKN